jgi:hypothetical protein
MGWALSHKGKASASENTWNPNDPPEAYSNPSIHARINLYTEMGRQVHGPEWDPSRAPLDGEVIMRVGQGKKHGHYYIGDSILDTASTPTLTAMKARSTSNTPPILSRPSATQVQVDRLQVISVAFIVTQFLHTFSLHCHIGMNYCRPGWMSKQRHTRRP